jgi:hypothetical protein
MSAIPAFNLRFSELRRTEAGRTRLLMTWGSIQRYGRIDGNVYRKSTGRVPLMHQARGFQCESNFSADYHLRYLAKNPNGYCGIGGCGVPFKLAELQVGEKA